MGNITEGGSAHVGDSERRKEAQRGWFGLGSTFGSEVCSKARPNGMLRECALI